MVQFLKAFLADRYGATSIEYGAIAILIAVAMLVALNAVSVEVADIYASIQAAFD